MVSTIAALLEGLEMSVTWHIALDIFLLLCKTSGACKNLIGFAQVEKTTLPSEKTASVPPKVGVSDQQGHRKGKLLIISLMGSVQSEYLRLLSTGAWLLAGNFMFE